VADQTHLHRLCSTHDTAVITVNPRLTHLELPREGISRVPVPQKSIIHENPLQKRVSFVQVRQIATAGQYSTVYGVVLKPWPPSSLKMPDMQLSDTRRTSTLEPLSALTRDSQVDICTRVLEVSLGTAGCL
jgi:hypothetical protein